MAIDILNFVNLKPILPKGWDIKFSPRFLSYRPSFEIEIETQKYLLKTANKMSELLNVFELRHQVFLEGKKGSENNSEYDVDKYDSICDHIIIVDKETNNIVGTYRVISSLFSSNFYSEEEFDLNNFLALDGEKMELGRACIHHGHRNGVVLDLLWKGICKYIKLTDAKYLFGCSSVKTTNKESTQLLLNYLKNENLLKFDHNIKAIGKFAMDLDLSGNYVENEENRLFVKNNLPSLLRSYFTAGAYVYGTPALDEEFECVDFLTILNTENMSSSYKKRYMGIV